MFRRLAFCLALCAAVPARADFVDLYANPLDMPQNKAPRIGHSRLVLIPVQIDGSGLRPVDVQQLRSFFTDPAAADHLNFNGYFAAASSGRYQGEVTVAPLVEYKGCPATLDAGCTLPQGSVVALSHGVDFVRDVFRRSHAENKVDFSAFDVNGLGGDPDGVIDGAMIVVNLPGANAAYPLEYVNNGSDLNGGNGGALVLDGIRIPYVAVGGATLVAGEQHLEYGVLRQFAKTLGFAELAYAHPGAGDRYPAWGGLHFSQLGDAPDSDQAILPDAESRRALGWQPHVVVSGTQELTLQPAAAGGFAVKLGMMNGKRREYFLVEARGPSGALDKGITDAAGQPTWGLAVYHVDWSVGPKAEMGGWVSRLIDCLDCDPFHPFVRNLESSGNFGLLSGWHEPHSATGGASNDQVLFVSGQTLASIPGVPPLSSTYRYMSTNYYDGTESGIAIKDIVINDNHTITASFTAPAVADPCADVTCPALEQCARTGEFAGSCLDIPAPPPQGGGGASRQPQAADASSGCSSTGSLPGLLALGALLALGLRNRARA